MEPFQFKRAAAVSKNISDINPEKDIRVRILGRVIDRGEGVIVVDDGFSKAEIVTDSDKGNAGDAVRVIARVLPLESGYELRAEIIQDMSKLDMELYKKAAGSR
ncbi:MAG: hypothetical protein J4431_01925 [Candidatus Aenigmarchaeota archaeon]|nr:hypothetical protein [Candidatus Aenigmarchaeota archaeon]